ncbi:sugar ABC transporter ATP-binding protein [Sporomusa sp.]|uniref:sugar ABC transporter ATP-binding protein n=1 Tax=Sporomusa sp. TaxID=2078658 RepID=UPI002B5A1818|nr:sugar ABC transporter ATP-binding protein [Sporomusa sp.]HWR43786.1 sugar ABC transporter ATP-binding protein [Sporomusa sp.]
MGEYALQMVNIKKSFSGVSALKAVNFSLKKGEIHALIGENGAGKSTLMNIVGGVLAMDEGSIYLEDNQVQIPNPHVSKSLGISFIHQELNLVGDLRVYENMFLGAELTNRVGLVKTKDMCDKTSEILKILGVDLDPKAYVRDIEPSYKQIVEIAKALLQDARIIIMDEPTTSLTDHEVSNLFKLMNSLKQSGVSIVFISHKLKEVLTICDSYTVLRDGAVAKTGCTEESDEEHLARLMVGKDVASLQYYQPRALGRLLLAVEGLSSGRYFRNVSFALHEGEILGFTGLTGDGRSELFECVFGCRRYDAGQLYVDSKKINMGHPCQALKHGIGLVPKNRKENAIIKDMSVLQNLTLASLSKMKNRFFIDNDLEEKRYWQNKEKLNIKAADSSLPIVSLSGGNQQKVVLAKWLEADSRIIIMDNPTQGIDVGAKSEIYQLIIELAKQGKGIVILSSELPEILKVCDRVFVMYHGEIAAELPREQTDEATIMMYATGAKRVG